MGSELLLIVFPYGPFINIREEPPKPYSNYSVPYSSGGVTFTKDTQGCSPRSRAHFGSKSRSRLGAALLESGLLHFL